MSVGGPDVGAGDASGYERLRMALIDVLKRSGGYEPAVDDLYVDRIVRGTMRSDEMERFLDSPTATAHTYAQITDAQSKREKMIENALHALAISRRDRLGVEGESAVLDELRAALMRGRRKNGEQRAG